MSVCGGLQKILTLVCVWSQRMLVPCHCSLPTISACVSSRTRNLTFFHPIRNGLRLCPACAWERRVATTPSAKFCTVHQQSSWTNWTVNPSYKKCFQPRRAASVLQPERADTVRVRVNLNSGRASANCTTTAHGLCTRGARIKERSFASKFT